MDSSTDDTSALPRRTGAPDRRTLYAVLFLIALDLALYGDVLVRGGSIVPCNRGSDAGRYFGPIRDFAYNEMANGNIPLWNPYIFSGTPCLAASQPALMYPLNLHYLVLPIHKSMSLEIALHTFLIALFMFIWARFWKIPHLAAVFTAVVTMLCGPYYLHVFAGHLTLLSTWAWVPLAFYGADAYIETRRFRHAFTGAAALAMALLAGHPQGAFEGGALLAAYSLLRLLTAQDRLRAVPGIAFIGLIPALLAAVQVWPTLALSSEMVRSGGLSYNKASSYSLPPENLLTLFAPLFFGDELRNAYWGRWLFWEMSAYVGIVTLALAAYGALFATHRVRHVWLILIIAIFVVALGRHTPLFGILWRVVPGFSMFRSPAKFLVFFAMFTAMLAGLGAGTLLERAHRVRPLAIASAIASVALAGLAAVVWRAQSSGAWGRYIASIQPDWETLRDVTDSFPHDTALSATISLSIAAGTCALLAVLFALSSKSLWCRRAIVAVGIVELCVFAYATRDTLDIATLRNDEVAEFTANWDSDVRVCDRRITNNLMLSRIKNIWGYDPASLRRYIELMAKTQGVDAESLLNEFNLRRPHRLFAMLNCAYMLDSRANSERVPRELGEPLSRFSFPNHVRVVADIEERLDILEENSFRPRRTVLLESEPDPAPSDANAKGAVRVTEESTDAITLDVTVDQNAILLMADAYANDWSITPLEPGPQDRYQIMPANHALRAIPLAAGHHVIRMVYAPPAYTIGLWVSIISTLLFCGAWVRALRAGPAGDASIAASSTPAS